MDVSVIVLTHNRPERCLDSVWHNALSMHGVDAEVLVINNGKEPVSIPPRIGGIPCRVIQMQENLGAAARNEGIRRAQGRYLFMLDDDAYLDPVVVESMRNAFLVSERVGAVAFRVEHDGREEGCLLPTVFHGCACAFRREALERAGGYPEGYLYYGEEYDLAFRLYQAGYRIVLGDPRRKVRHEKDASGRDAGRIISRLIRNNIRLIVTHFPWPAVGPACRDILQRYALVAGKEGVFPAFKSGLVGLPSAFCKGLRERRPLSRDVFEEACLIRAMRRAGEEVVSAGFRKVVVCGVGKFPSLWIAELRRQRIEVIAFRDHNPCWRNRHVGGAPVLEDGQAAFFDASDACWLTGTASTPENLAWERHLERGRGLMPVERYAAAGKEGTAPAASQDLAAECRIRVFSERFDGLEAFRSHGMTPAYGGIGM